jgi:POTRA domain, FtsQ-type
MDRSRRTTARGRPATVENEPVLPPSSSRLTLRARKNRRRPTSLWSRVPPPRTVADACGRALRRSLPAMVATCAVLGVCAALWIGYEFLTTSARYAITNIEVRGTHRLSADEVRAALPIALGDNIFKTSPDEVAGALHRHPWIAEAQAQRVLPDTIIVEIREHEAVAIAVLGEPYLVGADGHPFKRAQINAGDGAGLPIVTGLPRTAYGRDPEGTAQTITQALGALARWRGNPARPPIGELHVSTAGTLTLRTYDRGAAIEFGALGADAPVSLIDARLRTFDAAWAELEPAERERARALHLDARADHVTVAFAKD